jgi:hypothetical protein
MSIPGRFLYPSKSVAGYNYGSIVLYSCRIPDPAAGFYIILIATQPGSSLFGWSGAS